MLRPLCRLHSGVPGGCAGSQLQDLVTRLTQPSFRGCLPKALLCSPLQQGLGKRVPRARGGLTLPLGSHLLPPRGRNPVLKAPTATLATHIWCPVGPQAPGPPSCAGSCPTSRACSCLHLEAEAQDLVQRSSKAALPPTWVPLPSLGLRGPMAASPAGTGRGQGGQLPSPASGEAHLHAAFRLPPPPSACCITCLHHGTADRAGAQRSGLPEQSLLRKEEAWPHPGPVPPSPPRPHGVWPLGAVHATPGRCSLTVSPAPLS